MPELGGLRSSRCRRAWSAVTLVALLSTVGAPPAFAFDLQGHRGARGLAPENTLAAFRAALAIGVTTIETDLAMTKDGVLVLAHDPRLNPALVRDADGRWLVAEGPAIRQLTFDELRRYDVGRLNPEHRYARQWPRQQPADGERIPTLAQLIDLVKASGRAVRLNLETKLAPTDADTPEPALFARAVVEELRRSGMVERATIQSFDWRTLAEVKRIAPEIATACLTIEAENFDTVRADASGASPWHAGLKRVDHGESLPRLVKAAGCGTWSMFWRNLTPALAAEAKALGLQLLPWTVNEPAAMARLIDLGVDGIITDYPDRLRAVLAERGMRLPD
ncbi:glycerophosphodiester phosphodiesterase [Betaproteobacteria bacterium PRO7]|nr:glycerophosphodiester phosphodiesterase [Betaproteobacteria bacterium PRO7]